MARRVQNQVAWNFGTFGAAATITRIRQGKAAGDRQTLALAANVAVAQAEQFEIPANGFSIAYTRGALSDGHMTALVDGLYGNSVDGFESFTIDLGSASDLPIAVTGYAAVTAAAWVFATVAD